MGGSVIKEYISLIFNDFKSDIEQMHELCALRETHYNCQNIVDYNNRNRQQLYLLRYSFAYIFEYYDMYRRLSEKYYNSKIEITSIGCGAMLDYGALKLFLDNSTLSNCSVNYRAIDPVDWKYKSECRENIDCIDFYQKNVKEYFDFHKSKLTCDILFFPKSISELGIEDIKLVFNYISNNTFHIFISHRDNNEDNSKIEEIKQCLSEIGFKIVDEDISQYKDIGIKNSNYNYDYPDDAKVFLMKLHEKCKKHGNCKDKKQCEPNGSSDSLVRLPILRRNHLHNIIITVVKDSL